VVPDAKTDVRQQGAQQIVRANRAGGPERVLDAVEAAAPDGFERIDDVIDWTAREAIVKGYARLAGFAPDQVNHVDRPVRARGEREK
jgi:hypothetical protein